MADAYIASDLWQAIDGGRVQAIRKAAEKFGDLRIDPENAEIALERALALKVAPEGASARVRCLIELGARVDPSLYYGFGTSVHMAAERGYF